MQITKVHQWQRRSGKKDGVVRTCEEKERRERAVKGRCIGTRKETKGKTQKQVKDSCNRDRENVG